jgi:hypothetical protein
MRVREDISARPLLTFALVLAMTLSAAAETVAMIRIVAALLVLASPAAAEQRVRPPNDPPLRPGDTPPKSTGTAHTSFLVFPCAVP